jgi:hypothetical protein
MADLTLGESLHQLTDSSYHPWVWAIFSHIKLISLGRVCREWPGLTQLLQAMLPKDAKEKRRQHLEFSANMLDKRIARKPERPDIWSFITRNAGQEGALHQTELHSNGSLSVSLSLAKVEDVSANSRNVGSCQPALRQLPPSFQV